MIINMSNAKLNL